MQTSKSTKQLVESARQDADLLGDSKQFIWVLDSSGRISAPLAKSSNDITVPCLALRSKETARAIGISERKLWEITADQTSGIPHLRLGRAVLYPIRELQDWLASRAKAGKP